MKKVQILLTGLQNLALIKVQSIELYFLPLSPYQLAHHFISFPYAILILAFAQAIP